jgi:heat-inducible transcriptional repressor
MLDERKAAILRAVVEGYIETAQPVGSGQVARHGDIPVSPATVRNDMAQLERDGYLDHPHTSAGRIPTAKGYRFFVDHLEPGNLGPSQRHQVRAFFNQAHGELERMLTDTSRLLTDLTDYAAVVVAPQGDAATVRTIQLVGLAPGTALAVAVLSNGSVEKHTIDVPEELSDDALAAGGSTLARSLVGKTLVEAPQPDVGADPVVAAALASFRGSDDRPAAEVYVGGTARMAGSFEAVETVREVLAILEQQLVVVTLLRGVLDRGLDVAIGAETGVEPLADCSLVVAPYRVDGEDAGSIAVLGPTRMNYARALAAVAVVSQRLGDRLSEH